MTDLSSLIEQSAQACARARRGVALTGAGISIESGIPPFRGKGGLWEKIDPMKYAHIEALERNPAEVWQVLFLGIADHLTKAAPNAGHKGLHRLEQMGVLQTIITQNVDGLHQAAGSGDVIEFHGTHARLRCMSCHQSALWHTVSLEVIPPRCGCGGFLRPDVVMFGELIDTALLQRSQTLAATCDVMLVVGTSATVEPAAYLPVLAKHNSAFIIEINPEPTPLTHRISDVTLLGPAGEMMDRLVNKVADLRHGD
ncbi:MAG: NAD-dependent deacylase [Desulfobacteraceae bacterium]|nr:MAG: NAD-dependent deacylase [Desulfobacteraceae bacterium]